MNIALIGCGAISTSVLELLQSHSNIHIGWLLVSGRSIPAAQTLAAQYAPGARVLSALPATECPDMIVECAGHTAVEQHILPALERGIDAIVASIGALSAPGMPERVQAAAQAGGAQVHLVSGAIGGIDALAAARIGGLDEITYTGRKPPLAWQGTPAEQTCELAALTTAHCIFEGSAREAARLYPKNANVAATLSLAGLGLDHTRVRLYADPFVTGNVHEISASGAFGQIALTMHGKPLATNPKTSALTVYSVVRAILNRAASLVI